ncbi:DNA-directed RNA polymerase subunit K [Candidatus Pacearchaeota archaeon CG10_big_fil_rev_8_21_14_0_10_34_12]|nr:MAG: DNA-directed RNA polymerase subunit K [Candidatus Pacearchaeota archaeon CG10_big_fil_rev_8_21_14_0_10_34_12]
MENFTKYEKARILGARALQIAMNAPLLVKISNDDLEKIKYDALKIAEIEFESGILPISVKKPLPIKKEERLKRIKDKKVDDASVEHKEIAEEEEIAKEGEIMELANPDDEEEDVGGNSGEEE